jgi:hypothetical protein
MSSKKADNSRQRPVPEDRLFLKMSEVISLREKVAQAELAAHKFGLEQRDKTPRQKNKVSQGNGGLKAANAKRSSD